MQKFFSYLQRWADKRVTFLAPSRPIKQTEKRQKEVNIKNIIESQYRNQESDLWNFLRKIAWEFLYEFPLISTLLMGFTCLTFVNLKFKLMKIRIFKFSLYFLSFPYPTVSQLSKFDLKSKIFGRLMLNDL